MYNTHAIVDEQGVLIAAYRKMHLFDVDYDGLRILPSAPVPVSLLLMSAAHKDPFARVHALLFCMCRLLCSGLHLLRLHSLHSY
jgi:predicted amidohydrolase